MTELHPVMVDDEYDRPYLVKISPPAQRCLDDWWASHADERNDEAFPPVLDGPWAKARSYLARFALVAHCLRLSLTDPDAPKRRDLIELDDMRQAVLLVDYFKAHARSVYPLLTQRNDDRLTDRIVRWMTRTKRPEVTLRDVVQAHIVRKNSEAHDLFVDLADRGLGTIKAKRKTAEGANEPETFVLLPTDC